MDFFNHNSIIGLDIGYEALRLVQVKKQGNAVSLVGAIEVPLTERIMEGANFKNKAATANLIKEALRKAKPDPITATKIVSALPETFVFTKTIKLPKMQAGEYEGAVISEASQFLPIPLETAYIDFQILINHPDDAMVDVLVVAAPQKLVDDYVETAALAGLELVALETKPLSIGRALLSPQTKDGSLILHIGTEFSRISVWDGNKIRLISTVSAGKNQILELLGQYGSSAKSTPKITDENREQVDDIINKIVDEVVSAIKYHQIRDYQPRPIKRLLLCGSAAKIGGLDSIIESEVGVPVTIAVNKFANKETLGPEFVSACGLALRNDF